MRNFGSAAALVAVMALATLVTRLFPFVVFGRRGGPSAAVQKLGAALPMAVMAILVIYCLRQTSLSSAAGFVPQLISCAVVAALHVWKRNNLLSIAGGTVCYMVLLQTVFA